MKNLMFVHIAIQFNAACIGFTWLMPNVLLVPTSTNIKNRTKNSEFLFCTVGFRISKESVLSGVCMWDILSYYSLLCLPVFWAAQFTWCCLGLDPPISSSNFLVAHGHTRPMCCTQPAPEIYSF